MDFISLFKPEQQFSLKSIKLINQVKNFFSFEKTENKQKPIISRGNMSKKKEPAAEVRKRH